MHVATGEGHAGREGVRTDGDPVAATARAGAHVGPRLGWPCWSGRLRRRALANESPVTRFLRRGRKYGWVRREKISVTFGIRRRTGHNRPFTDNNDRPGPQLTVP